MSEQQVVFVLGFDYQEQGTISVLRQLLGEDVVVVYYGVDPEAWWLVPQRHASKLTLVTEVKTDLPWNRVDTWLKGAGFTRFLAKQIIDQSGLTAPPSLILVNTLILEKPHFQRALKTIWPKVKRQAISDVLMKFRDSDAYRAHLANLDDFLIEELDLGVRGYNCLKRAGIQTIGDLAVRSLAELAALPNMSDEAIKEITERMDAHGVVLI